MQRHPPGRLMWRARKNPSAIKGLSDRILPHRHRRGANRRRQALPPRGYGPHQQVRLTQLVELATRVNASAFLVALVAAVPNKIHTVLTDNGIQFRFAPCYANGPTTQYITHMFDMRCLPDTRSCMLSEYQGSDQNGVTISVVAHSRGLCFRQTRCVVRGRLSMPSSCSEKL